MLSNSANIGSRCWTTCMCRFQKPSLPVGIEILNFLHFKNSLPLLIHLKIFLACFGKLLKFFSRLNCFKGSQLLFFLIIEYLLTCLASFNNLKFDITSSKQSSFASYQTELHLMNSITDLIISTSFEDMT